MKEKKFKNGLETPNARFLSYAEKHMLLKVVREILVRPRIIILRKEQL